ncbi:MAG: SpoIIE family protein phosphatase [Treponema sp.]|nr:SpoIIE family protein phosphatase [Treponema sp.]
MQKLARYFRTVLKNETIAVLADDLDRERRIPAVCVVDDKFRPLGVVKRDKVFLLLGKRFGRELMGKSRVQEIAEEAPVFSGETNILVLSQLLSAALKGDEKENDYIILTGANGVFSGMLSFRDLSNYFVDMTNRDIAAASLLQERFLANADEPGNKGIQVNTWSAPAKGVGGDFYFIKNLGESRFFAALCDVSGKGISASLVVSMAWGFLRAYTINGGLRNLLIDLNDSIVSTFHLEKYLTGFFLIYDSLENQLQFADMGHSHGIFIRNRSVHTLEKTRINLPIGVEADIKPVIFRIKVKPADALFIYTDGIPEQDNPEGEEFGDERLLELIRECQLSGKKPDGVLPAALDNFRKNTPQRDDMTCLFFRF